MNMYDTAMMVTVKNKYKLLNPVAYRDLINTTIDRYAAKYNVPAGVIKKVIMNESGFWFKTAGSSIKNVPVTDQKKYGLASEYREYGLMQVYPHYAALDGFDWRKIVAYDIDENINAGTFHLRDHFNQVVDFLQGKPFSVTDSIGNILRRVTVPYKISNWFFVFTFGIASYNGGVQGIVKALEAGNFQYAMAFKHLQPVTQDYMSRFHENEVV